MTATSFLHPQDSHNHSLITLNALFEYDDFMESIKTLADMGCGTGLDLEWWATRTTRDDRRRSLDIQCTGIDLIESVPVAHKYKNIRYQQQDFCDPIMVHKKKFDVIWCHDAFQYVIDPFTTLRNWYDVASDNAMLILILPQTTNVDSNRLSFEQTNGCYWHWTLVNLMHVLAVSGWDCGAGFFRKEINDPWLHAVVYKSKHKPLDPKKITWYELSDLGLLPDSAVKCINKFGYLKQRELLLPWLDRSLHWFGNH